MADYATRKKPAEGKVQDLFAKALALEDDRVRRALPVSVFIRNYHGVVDWEHFVSQRAAAMSEPLRVYDIQRLAWR